MDLSQITTINGAYFVNLLTENLWIKCLTKVNPETHKCHFNFSGDKVNETK